MPVVQIARRHSALTTLLAVLLAASLWIAPGAQAREDAIRGVIADQIEAFRADDFARAFDHASDGIRRMFGTPERFGRMVREGYPMVYRPETLRFGALREAHGRLWQRVIVTDGDGRLHMLEYEMIEGENGWRINGVMRAPGQGAGA